MQRSNANSAFKVRELYKSWSKDLGLSLVAGKKGLNRNIKLDRVQKPGLRMIDSNIQLEDGKIQIFGRTELRFFDSLPPIKQKKIAQVLAEKNIPVRL